MQQNIEAKNVALQEFLQQLLSTHQRPACCWREDGVLLYATENFLQFFHTEDVYATKAHFPYPTNHTPDTPTSPISNPFFSYFSTVLQDGFCQFPWEHTIQGHKVAVTYSLSHVQYLGEKLIIGVLLAPSPPLSDCAPCNTTSNKPTTHLLAQNALNIIEASPTAIGIWNADHQIISCNSIFLKLFNVQSLDEHKEKLNTFFPEFQPCGTPSTKFAYRALDQAFAEGHIDIEWLWHDEAGSPLPTMTSLRRIYHEGTPLVIEYIYDLRKLQRIAEMTKEAEERMQIMLDSMPLSAHFLNKNLENIDCNMAAAQLLGFDCKKDFLESFEALSPEYQPNGRLSSELRPEILNRVFREGYGEIEWMHTTRCGEAVPTRKILIRTEYKGEDVVLAYSKDLREIHASIRQANYATEKNTILFNTTPLCITLWNEDLEMLDCNEEVLRFFNLKDKQEYLNNILSVMPEFQPNGQRSDVLVWDFARRVFETGYHRFEWMHQGHDGTPIPMEVTMVRAMLDGKAIAISYARDLRKLSSARHKAEAIEQYCSMVLNATPLSIIIWDTDFRMLDCNDEALRLFGFSHKQNFLPSFYALHPEFQPDGSISAKRVFENFAQVLKDGYSQFTWMHQKINGTLFPAEVTLVRSSSGGKDFVVSFMRDLSKLSASQSLLREAELRNELMLDSLPLGVHFWNDKKELIYSNMAGVRLFGFESMEDYLRDFLRALPETQPDGSPSVESLYKLVDKACNSDFMITEFTGMHSTTKELIPVEVTIKRISYQGKVGLISYIRDLRELKNMLREIHETDVDLRHAQKSAEKNYLEKSDFLANISSEIHTPMNGILNLLYLLNGAQLRPEQEKYVRKTLFSANNLLRTIHDVLDISKVEAGKLEMQISLFTLEELYHEMLQIYEPQCQAKGIQLFIDMSSYSDTVLSGDAQRLKQVLFNLVSNAIKSTETGSIEVRTECTLLGNNSMQCLFAVKDTGVGLSSDELTKLFSAFAQADSSVCRKHDDCALGLTLSRSLVKMMHGDLWAQSELGQGATFFFTAVFSIPSAKHPTAENNTNAPSQSTASRGHILLVEEYDINQYITKKLLRQADYSVDIAKHGQEALGMLEKGQYDLVLMDTHMPIMDGLTATQKIRAQERFASLPIIGMSEHESHDYHKECLALGMNDHITKPINPTILYQALRQWLKKS